MFWSRRWSPRACARPRISSSTRPILSDGTTPTDGGTTAVFDYAIHLSTYGWHMVELAASPALRGLETRVVLLDRCGNVISGDMVLPLKSARIAKRLCFIPFSCRRIRFEFPRTDVEVRISFLQLVWMLPWAANQRLLLRLQNNVEEFRGLSFDRIVASIKRESAVSGVPWRAQAQLLYERTFNRFSSAQGYSCWIETRERRRSAMAPAPASDAPESRAGPLISLFLRLELDDASGLADCVTALRAQFWRNWELIVVSPTGADCVELAGKTDDLRIRYCAPKDLGRSAASGGVRARGSYLACLSISDLLREQALLRVVEKLTPGKEPDLIYSDSDLLNEAGVRNSPCFKTEWNPDLLISHDYLGNPVFWRARFFEENSVPESALVELSARTIALQVWRSLSAGNVEHVPEVLFHRVVGAGKRAAVLPCIESGHVEAASHCLPNGATAKKGMLEGSVRISWSLPEPKPLVSILIPTRDGLSVLRRAVSSVLSRTAYPNFELLVLDNDSRDPDTLRYFEEIGHDQRVSVHRWEHPFNFSAINNFGVAKAAGSVIGLLNNDIEVINDDWLDEMVSHAIRPEIGCVGAKLYYPDGTIQHAGVVLGVGGVAGHAHRHFAGNDDGYCGRLKLVQNFSAVTAACLLVRKATYLEVGGLDEINLPVAYNDVDLCLKVREAGYRNLWTPYAELYHHESATRGADDTPKKRARAEKERRYMRHRWGKLLDNDPYYNPNLTLIHEDFSLR